MCLCAGHVIPGEQLLPVVMCSGPSGIVFDFSFQQREHPPMVGCGCCVSSKFMCMCVCVCVWAVSTSPFSFLCSYLIMYSNEDLLEWRVPLGLSHPGTLCYVNFIVELLSAITSIG